MKTKKTLSTDEQQVLIDTLKARFEKNTNRHKDIEWEKVSERLKGNAAKLWSLQQMEATGGEPDVVGYDKVSGAYIFYDCAAESPKGRRSTCYDYEALMSRKEHKPKHSAMGMAAEMGIDILTEEEYYALQQLGAFDLKTSSWVATPDEQREHGGAIFCDCRFGRVFTYHNGAESYYGSRGFRGVLKI